MELLSIRCLWLSMISVGFINVDAVNICDIYQTQKAGDKDGVYGQIGEGLRQNPESILSWHKSESEIRNLVTSGTYAAINVRLDISSLS